jgi:hypothetical protein
MGHYARVDRGVVQEVIVADSNYIENAVFEKPGNWIKCSYNTYGGIYYESVENRTVSEDQSKALRKNFPSTGWMYDGIGFYPPKHLFPESYTLDENTHMWVAPREQPDDGQKYIWNEDELDWEVLPEDDAWMDSYQG